MCWTVQRVAEVAENGMLTPRVAYVWAGAACCCRDLSCTRHRDPVALLGKWCIGCLFAAPYRESQLSPSFTYYICYGKGSCRRYRNHCEKLRPLHTCMRACEVAHAAYRRP